METEKPEPKVTDPVCPYCGDDPLKIHYKSLKTPEGLILLLVNCANLNCRKVLGVSFQTQVDLVAKKGGRLIEIPRA